MHVGTKVGRLATGLVVFLTALTVVMLSGVWVMKTAGLDLHAQAALARGPPESCNDHSNRNIAMLSTIRKKLINGVVDRGASSRIGNMRWQLLQYHA